MKNKGLFDGTEAGDSRERHKAKTPVTCLGRTFASDDERRAYYREELRTQLPELKKIEGFPIGDDDDIINLSDPPYYTACPNPWLNDFIAEWENDKKELEAKKKRKAVFEVNEPYASDVSEGKNNPIYNAHSYHTKVPHPAIMRYIMHYTQPGDIVFDGFAGTGMTGVAVQLCGNPDPELKTKIETEFDEMGLAKPVWGARKAICGDLSPIASFIAYNYNTPVDVGEFEREARRILDEVEEECGWMYETNHINPQTKKKADDKGRINYTVWSDVFICPNCGGEIIFWDAAYNKKKVQMLDEFPCTQCHAKQSKSSLDKAMVTSYDKALNISMRQAKTLPVLINYTYAGKRYEKKPDKNDMLQLNKIDDIEIPFWYPKNAMMGIGSNWGETWRAGVHIGITHVHHFYTKRNLYVLSAFLNQITNNSKYAKSIEMNKQIEFIFTSMLPKLTRMNRFMPQHGSRALVGPMANTLYVPSLFVENNIFDQFTFQEKKIRQVFPITNQGIVNVSSCTNYQMNINTIDYIFVDPPFGANIMYSELNYLYESWLKVKTNNIKEAIENKSQNKTKNEYQQIMIKSFEVMYQLLKPSKWMTVEFSNTSSIIWNSIQYAIQKSGFVIANVSAINKERPGLQGMIGSVAVKQDLVISCYKPSDEFDVKFKKDYSDVNVWLFVKEHLEHLPVIIHNKDKINPVSERDPRILYDRLITFYLMRGLPIPIDAGDFQEKLRKQFVEQDNLFFLPDQAVEYKKEKQKYGITDQLEFVFDLIYSENDALQWLKSRLKSNPQKYNEIMPDFRKANTATRKGEKEIELKVLLEENFIELTDGKWRVPDHTEAKDREILRTKALLREFSKYAEELANPKTKKLKDVRVEALRAGFKHSWEKKDFKTIVWIGDKIPQNLLMEDEQLLMFYDIAKDRV